MTEQQLEKHRKWCRQKWNSNGDDIFQTAYMIVLSRYGNIEKVNQNLFSKICREAARELKKHEMHEIPFSCLQTENKDREEFAEFDFTDPTWKRQYIAIEEREEVEKLFGKWLLNALLNAATEPKPARKEEEQLQFAF
jgi:hypothetical protein